MLRTTASVGTDLYVLATDADVEAVKRNIESAIRAGGGFVDLDLLAERTVSVLVSAGMHLIVETTEVDIDVDIAPAGRFDVTDHSGVEYDFEYSY
jgi:hypothetical protein